MRKLISLGVLALTFSLFSGQVFAEKTEACELIKKDAEYQTLYGLCNAYWNADDTVAQQQIFLNLLKKVGSEEEVNKILGIETSASCPCWDFEALQGVVACSGLPYAGSFIDPSDEATMWDAVFFQDSSVSIQILAGFTFLYPDFPEDKTECAILGAVVPGSPAYAPTNELEDAACREHILDLIETPPTSADCDPSAP